MQRAHPHKLQSHVCPYAIRLRLTSPTTTSRTDTVVEIYRAKEQKRQEANEAEQRQAAHQVQQAEEAAIVRQEADHKAAMAALDNEIESKEAEKKEAVQAEKYGRAQDIADEIDRLKAVKVPLPPKRSPL